MKRISIVLAVLATATALVFLPQNEYLSTVFAASRSYRVDFGPSGTSTTVAGWNNITDPRAATAQTLVDSTGAAGALTLRISNSFYYNPNQTLSFSSNTTGSTSSTVYPTTVTRDSFFIGSLSGYNDTAAALVVGGLASDKTYSFRFYASRMAGDTANRTTRYRINTTTVELNATNNHNNYVEINNVTTATGTVTVNITRATGAGYGYLGALEITETSADAPQNQLPTANAGTDKTVTLPTDAVSLVGSGSDTDGSITSYAWTKMSGTGGTIVSPASASTTVSGLSYGSYVFRLTVTDNQGAVDTDDVAVSIEPAPNSCSAKTIVVLGSSTAAGYGLNPVSNSWVNRYGAYLDDRNSENTVINLAVGGYTTYHILPSGTTVPGGRPTPVSTSNITAALGNDPDAIIVNMPSNDTASGYSVAEQQENFRTLAAAAQNADVPIWFTTTQPRNLSSAQRNELMLVRDWILSTYGTHAINFFDPVANADGTIRSQYDQGDGIHVTADGHAVLNNQTITRGVIDELCSGVLPNQNPTANAGTDLGITLPTSAVSLIGSGSDADGTIASYLWTKVSGGTASITSPANASTAVTGLTAGSYVFRLTVTDDDGATATDDVAVMVSEAPNIVPSVSTGLSTVILAGTATDADGTIASYLWTKVSGGTATIVSPTSPQTQVSGLSTGTYVFRLTVTDNDGATATSDRTVTIN